MRFKATDTDLIKRSTNELRRKLYISDLAPGALNNKLQYDWYAARADGGIVFREVEPHFSYPFGGSIEEVKEWISSRPTGIRHYFSWVPREFVIEHLFGIKNYPS